MEIRIAIHIESFSSFGRQLIRGVSRYARQVGNWSVHHNRDSGEAFERFLHKWRANGLIAHSKVGLDRILAIDLPKVIALHDGSVVSGREVGVLVADNFQIGQMGAQFFIDQGLRNFGFCGHHYSWAIQRMQGFTDKIGQSGLSCTIFTRKHTSETQWLLEQSESIIEWVRSLEKPAGIMACNDLCARQLIDACKLGGIEVPEQVCILGVDNDEMVCNMAPVTISSVALDCQQAGYQAARMLDAMISCPSKPGNVIAINPTYICTRESTDLLAIDDPDLSKAISFIRKNYKEMIQVSDVVAATNLSRRTLEKKFRARTDRSVLEEIRRLRINEMAKMLAETNLPIKDIASSLGYSSIKNISRYFKKEKMMSCTEWRKTHGFRH